MAAFSFERFCPTSSVRAFNSTSSQRSGFTLLELTIGMGLVAVIFTISAMVSISGRNAFVSTRNHSQLESRLETALNRVAIELELATDSSLNPQMTGLIADTNTISFRKIVGINAGVPVLGTLTSIGYQPDSRDPVDGADNDGDGLIDEGALVMNRNIGGPSPISAVLCQDVRRFLEGETSSAGDENANGLFEESGFLIERDGDLLTLWLTLEEALPNGESAMRTSSTSILIRN